jgi:hypothetical protein
MKEKEKKMKITSIFSYLFMWDSPVCDVVVQAFASLKSWRQVGSTHFVILVSVLYIITSEIYLDVS